MIPFEFEVATSITAISVGGILTIYLSVLKRNGWIGKAASNQSKTELKEKSASDSTKKAVSAPVNKSPEPKEITSPAVKEKSNGTIDDKKTILKEKLTKQLMESQQHFERQDVPSRCNHYFGYLFSLKKNAAIPDECYSCSKLIQCFQKPKTEIYQSPKRSGI